jgi:8-oxo-dGTP pyrophosphatase MutT (NUDIX family)
MMNDPRLPLLVGMLEAYVPDPGQEPAHSAMLQLASGGGDVFSADRVDPGHFTASGYVLAPDRSRLVLVHHARLGVWVQPGGHVDPGDAGVVAAAEREIQEETGLADLVLLDAGLFDLDVHPIPARPTLPAHRHYDLRFLFLATGEELQVSPESLAVRWVALTELDAIGADSSLRRAAAKLAPLMETS